MKTFDEVVREFLDVQKERLKPRTFNDYDSVMDLFKIYLNAYAYQYLPTELSDDYEDQYMEDESHFTKTFGLDQLDPSLYAEFFEYFIIQKVASSESFIKSAVRVLKKFTNWLIETEHISQSDYENLIDYFGDNKGASLANAEKVAHLIYELAMNSPDIEYDDVLEDYFTISKIEPKKLWIDSMFEAGTDIGPIAVTKQISDLSVTGWDISLVIGKKDNKWTILESGNVYPKS